MACVEPYYETEECPQGQFLRHVLDSGYTAISWWDRTQYDKRGAINSTILLEGEHTSDEVLAAGREHFRARRHRSGGGVR
jgi:hypothetical protein